MERTTTAQEATPPDLAALAAHPVVGTWEIIGELADNTFPLLAMVHADGAYLEIYPWGTIAVGVWKPTGERTAERTIVIYEFINDRPVRGEGRWGGAVDSGGGGDREAIDTDGPYVARYEGGTGDLAIEGPASGTRLPVQPVVPLAELVPGGTPVIPADLTDEATPAA